jgi:hypothetical protein
MPYCFYKKELDEEENVLVELCMDYAWDNALLRVASHPHEAAMVPNEYKSESALNWAAYGDASVALLQAIAAAGPELVTKVHNSNTLPADVKDKVLAVLAANPVDGAKLSIYPVFHTLRRAIDLVFEKYPDHGAAFPATSPFTFLEQKYYNCTPERRAGIEQTWHIFDILVKVAHHKTMGNLDSLPLVPALVGLNEWLRYWEDGCLQQSCGISSVRSYQVCDASAPARAHHQDDDDDQYWRRFTASYRR